MDIDEKEIQEIISQKIKDGEKKYGKEFKFLVLEIIGLEKMITPAAVQEEQKSRLIPLVKWNEFHPDPSVNALRMLVFRKEQNGFNDVITRRGHRILIDEAKYFQWAKVH